jgi:hypothetical protein
MKELYEAIYDMWSFDNMTLEQIALKAGISVDEVTEVIAFMALIGY